MARQPRFILPGQPQHVIQRGNNRQAIFHQPKDYIYFLEKLSLAAETHLCQIHAYVLMTNHIHLLVTPLMENSMSKMMQSLGRNYVQYFNYNYQRTGTLWEGRFKASLISTEAYLLTCMRYIELNPLRANMVQHPSIYAWSSYQCNALGIYNPLITFHSEYERLGKTLQERQNAYQELFKEPLLSHQLKEIQEATDKCWAIGAITFNPAVIQKLNRKIAPSLRGGNRKSRAC